MCGACLLCPLLLQTNKLPTDLQMQESTVYDRVGAMFSWVRELVLIWPSNMLAAKIEAPEAAEALQLAFMHMQNVLMLEQVRVCWRKQQCKQQRGLSHFFSNAMAVC